jgi:hypothetical protein
MISTKENAGLAKHLFTRTLTAHAIARESLIPTCQHATQQLPSVFIYNKWAPLLEYTDVP